MRRSIAFMKHKVEWWKARVLLRTPESLGGDTVLMEGIRAYAYRQANIREQLALKFEDTWDKKVIAEGGDAEDSSGEDDDDDEEEDNDDDVVADRNETAMKYIDASDEDMSYFE